MTISVFTAFHSHVRHAANHGRIGARFRLIPDARFRHQISSRSEPPFFDPAHFEVYEIEERREEWDHIYIRARYVGREDSVPTEKP